MRSNLKSNKKLSHLMDLFLKDQCENLASLTSLLDHAELDADPVRVNRCLVLTTNGQRMSRYPDDDLTALRTALRNRWFARQTWSTATFWPQVKRALRYSPNDTAFLQELSDTVAPLVMASFKELECIYLMHSHPDTYNSQLYKLLVSDTRAKTPVNEEQLGWSKPFLDGIRPFRHPWRPDAYINNHHLPFSLRLAYLREMLERHVPSDPQIEFTWFSGSSSQQAERIAFAQMAAAFGSETAVEFLELHSPQTAALVRICQSLGLDTPDILERIEQSGTTTDSHLSVAEIELM